MNTTGNTWGAVRPVEGGRFDLQRDALIRAGVARRRIYCDHAAGQRDDCPNLPACLKALRRGDVLVVWKLDRLGRDLRHLVNTV